MGNPTKRKGAGDWSNGKTRGRRKMVTPEQFMQKVDEYIAQCGEDRPCLEKAILFIGFKSIQTLHDYQKDPAYHEAVGYLRLQCKAEIKQQIVNGRGDAGGVYCDKQLSMGVHMHELRKMKSDLERVQYILDCAAEGMINEDVMAKLVAAYKVKTDIYRQDELERKVEELLKLAGVSE